MNVKAFGTFESLESYIFRTNAYLQFGNSTKHIGLIIMLNPGSSCLADDDQWDDFLSKSKMVKNISISNELKLDSTMKSVVELLLNSDPTLEGRLTILNLFNIRCGNSNKAIQTYTTLLKKAKFNILLHSPLPNLTQYPWIWTAWSVKDATILNSRKIEFLEEIPKNKKIALYSRQKIHQTKKQLYCYHPSPQKETTRKWVQSEMIKQLKTV